ncbi:hypothetical protein CWS43_23465 [Rahnella sp. AA]|nr:hypothetical protein CWS43_23465 [Rahnella sp. AA]
MIMTPLNGGCADEKVTIHRRADCFALKQAELGTSVPDVCRKLGFSAADITLRVFAGSSIQSPGRRGSPGQTGLMVCQFENLPLLRIQNAGYAIA